jgi:hypothetical protein
MNDTNAKMETLLEKFTERTLTGNYALWHALLTVDAIVISVFTAGISYVEHSVQLLLLPTIFLALVSAGLVITNFRKSRDQMKYHGYLVMGLASQMSEEEKGADLARAQRGHAWMVWRERAVEFIALVQGVLIVFLVFYVTCYSQKSH